MRHYLLSGVFTLLAVLTIAGCQHGRQQMPTLPEVQPWTVTVSIPMVTPQPVSIRLPLVANGSDLTATPFQPAAATPQILLAQTEQPEPPSDTRPDFPRLSAPAVTAIPPPMPLLGDQAIAGDSLTNILLIGADQRSGAFFRTDTLIIASIRPAQQVVTLISIPRDLFVYIPGWTMQRINTAYLHGELVKYPGRGAALIKDTILYNLGVRIDHIAIINFDGFKKIVDALGGVDLPLYCPYTDWRVINPHGNLENPANWRLYTVEPGLVHMDGELALWYARSRLRSNDYDRGRRQQEVLRGMYTQAMKINIIPRLPGLYQQLGDVIKTDMQLENLLMLAPMALKLDAPRIRSFYINNRLVKSWWTPDGANVLLPKRENIQALVQEAMSPPDTGEEARLDTWIEIANHTSNPGWDMLAAERLHYAGFETLILPPDGDGPAKKTWLTDLTGDPSQAALILALLGVPTDRQIAGPAAAGQAGYRLDLGTDYDPCFNPSKINK